MAATVLNSKQAVEMGVFGVRAFVRSRQMLAGSSDSRRQNKGIASPEYVALRSQFCDLKHWSRCPTLSCMPPPLLHAIAI